MMDTALAYEGLTMLLQARRRQSHPPKLASSAAPATIL